jgi:hypothetical protein
LQDLYFFRHYHEPKNRHILSSPIPKNGAVGHPNAFSISDLSMRILIIPVLLKIKTGKLIAGGEKMIKQPSRDELKKSVSNDKTTAKKEGINTQSGSNKSNNIFEALDAKER